ncbi:MAG TPA: PhzF family phenazine biosynthesis protein [Streptosporangiaceae bacterium]|nr:PhzF family phenazine biosynthesis protein [Streptosporangiaceae bacterium]
MTTARLLHVDSFASAPFTGNPAAVLVLDHEPGDEFGAQAGAELNQPATAVVWPAGQPGRFGLRWFTAATELVLCGHGTLAAARVLLDSGAAVAGTVRFETMSGTLEARAAGEWVQLRLPSLPLEPLVDAATAEESPGEAEPGEAVLGEAVRQLLPVPVTALLRSELDVLAVLGSADEVRAAQPDLAALRRLPVRGLIITAPGPDSGSGDGADFVSRFFAPATGIDEDAVTGSAHCALGPYWIARLGREPLLGRQLSARGGMVQVALDSGSVLLSGPALVLSEGSWQGPTG